LCRVLRGGRRRCRSRLRGGGGGGGGGCWVTRGLGRRFRFLVWVQGRSRDDPRRRSGLNDDHVVTHLRVQVRVQVRVSVRVRG
jgi:hypothetical protein